MTENNEHLALWGGRFTSGPSPELARLSKSTQFDWRLADDDIAGSRAHARALGRAGLLTADELQRMEDALDTLQRHVDDGSFAPIEDDEDEATALAQAAACPKGWHGRTQARTHARRISAPTPRPPCGGRGWPDLPGRGCAGS